jgi:sortase A
LKLKIVMRENPGRRAIRLALLVVGVVCIGIYCEAWLYRTSYQIYENWKFDHEPAVVEDTPPPRPSHPAALPAVLPSVLPDPDRGAPAPAISEPRGVVGRISIPRLHLSAIVEEGIDESTLSRAVGHIPGTALPGEDGNAGIAGHRDTFFRELKDLQPNDKIDFTTHSGRYHYIVKSLTIVEPSDVSVLAAKGGKVLTIVTCFPFHYIGNAPRRFIVHAVAE